MYNSTVLEVAIGLVFCYASVALITSAIYEAIASWLNLRSKTLFNGVQRLLSEDEGSDQTLLLGIYNHALANPLGTGTAKKIKEIKTKPSYIESKSFAAALVDTVQSTSGDFVKLRQDINGIKNDQIRQLLLGMYNNSSGKIENLHNDLATWFDAGMDRLSGDYKRDSQLWCFVIALVLAGIFNIDSFQLFKTLWQHPALVQQFSSSAVASQDLGAIQALPIGWSIKALSPYFILGWLVTASASLFGGPFWFDLLKLLINLRGTGNKPERASDLPADSEKLRQSVNTDNEVLDLRNSIIELHSVRSQNDDSYRPIQSEERW